MYNKLIDIESNNKICCHSWTQLAINFRFTFTAINYIDSGDQILYSGPPAIKILRPCPGSLCGAPMAITSFAFEVGASSYFLFPSLVQRSLGAVHYCATDERYFSPFPISRSQRKRDTHQKPESATTVSKLPLDGRLAFGLTTRRGAWTRSTFGSDCSDVIGITREDWSIETKTRRRGDLLWSLQWDCMVREYEW